MFFCKFIEIWPMSSRMFLDSVWLLSSVPKDRIGFKFKDVWPISSQMFLDSALRRTKGPDQMTPAARCSCSSPSLYNPNVSSWKPILFPVCTRADTHLLCVHLQYNLGKMRFLCTMLSFHPGKVREGYFCFPYMRSHTHASSDFLWFWRFCVYFWNRHACATLTF